ncbi:hypothetical protein AVEN_68908-1, partial [Araneus ventricosus]
MFRTLAVGVTILPKILRGHGLVCFKSVRDQTSSLGYGLKVWKLFVFSMPSSSNCLLSGSQ